MTIKRLTKEDLPQSMGTFKPVGHVLIAFRTDRQAHEATEALRQLGSESEDILYFSCEELCVRMDRMLKHVSEFAGFGYEVVLMRRYRALCEEGTCSWLLVYAPNDEQTQRVADIARRFDSLTAVKYNRLVEEDLL